jgi:hypothetical protein
VLLPCFDRGAYFERQSKKLVAVPGTAFSFSHILGKLDPYPRHRIDLGTTNMITPLGFKPGFAIPMHVLPSVWLHEPA